MTHPYTDVRILGSAITQAALTAFLRQHEADGRRVVAISVTLGAWPEHQKIHPATLVTVSDGDAPAAPLELIAYQTAEPPPLPAGKARVCIGRCFIAGKERNVLVYR